MISSLRTLKYGKDTGIRAARYVLVAIAVLVPTRASADEAATAALRQSCQTALQGTDPSVARDACQRAYLAGKTAEDLRHNVAALVMGKRALTMGELVEAGFKADVAVKIAPNQPWGYAARALVALKIADRDMLDRALADLKRVAPDHAETHRIVAAAAADRPMLAVPGMWLLLAVFVGTLAHALRNNRKTRLPSMQRAIVVLALCALGIGNGTARAATMNDIGLPGSSKIDDANPEANLPTPEEQVKDPVKFGMLLQDMLASARDAEKKGDNETAARYYRALTKAVATAYGPAHLCETLIKMNDREGALAACREAVVREGVTVADYDRLADLLMLGADPLPKEIRAEINGLVEHVKTQRTAAGVGAEQFLCRVGTRFHDVALLESCTEALARVGAKDPISLTFEWNLAMEKHDFRAARKIVDEARKSGMPPNAIGMMDDATSTLRRRWYLRAGAWLVGLLTAAYLVRLGVRRYGLPGRRLAT
jgi:hypothetical protein